MEFKLFDMEHEVCFEDGYVYILELCNKQHFLKTIMNLYAQANDIDVLESCMIFDDGERLDFKDSVLLVGDPFSAINLQKQSTTKLVKYIVEKMSNLDVAEESLNYLNKIKNEFEAVLNELEITVEYNDMANLHDLIKMLAPKVKMCDFGDVLKTYCGILKVISILKIAKLAIFIDAKKYLSEEQLTELYKTAMIYDVNLILIESSSSKGLLKYEYKISVDEDLYELIKK